jgi:DNA-binding MarR family transcriptional regulator
MVRDFTDRLIDRLSELQPELEMAGLQVTARLPDPGDRRGVIVELTDRGAELVDAAVRANVANGRQLLSRLEPEEIQVFETLLRKVLSGLELPQVE